MHPLNKLEVHTDALELVKACYRHAHSITEFDLRTQLLRSARSIAANLAEGAGSSSQAVFARYVAIALASGRETLSHLQMARISRQLNDREYEDLSKRLSILMPRMFRLRSALIANAKRQAKTKS